MVHFRTHGINHQPRKQINNSIFSFTRFVSIHLITPSFSLYLVPTAIVLLLFTLQNNMFVLRVSGLFRDI